MPLRAVRLTEPVVTSPTLSTEIEPTGAAIVSLLPPENVVPGVAVMLFVVELILIVPRKGRVLIEPLKFIAPPAFIVTPLKACTSPLIVMALNAFTETVPLSPLLVNSPVVILPKGALRVRPELVFIVEKLSSILPAAETMETVPVGDEVEIVVFVRFIVP